MWFLIGLETEQESCKKLFSDYFVKDYTVIALLQLSLVFFSSFGLACHKDLVLVVILSEYKGLIVKALHFIESKH